MKSAFPILAAAALLLGAGSAQAARPMGGNSNIILPPAPPLQSSLPPMTNSAGALGTTGQQSFGARFRAIRDRPPTIPMQPCPVWATLDRRLRLMRGRRPRASIPRAPTSTAEGNYRGRAA